MKVAITIGVRPRVHEIQRLAAIKRSRGLRFGLRSKLLALVVLAIVPALGLIILLGLEERSSARSQVNHETEELALLVAGQYSETREGVRQLLASFSTVNASDLSRCNEAAGKLLGDLPQYHNVGVASPDGNVICSGLSLNGPLNISDRRFFTEAVATGQFSEGEFQVGRLTGLPNVGFAYPFITQSGFAGVAVATLDLAWMGRALGGVTLPEGAQVILFDRNGTVMAAYPENAVVGRSYAQSSLFQSMTRSQRTTFPAPGLDGTKQLFSSVHLGGEDDGAFLSVGVPASVAYSDATARLWRNLGLLTLAGALAVAAAWLFGEELLVRPARALVVASRRIAAGDLSARSEVRNRNDEIGELALRFDEMAAKLESRNDLLYTERAALKKVTAELARRVTQLNGLQEVFSKITEHLTTDEVVRSALQEALNLSGGDVAVLRLLREHRLEVAGSVTSEPGLEVELDSVPVGQGLMGRVAAHRQTIRLDRDARLQMSKGQLIPSAESGVSVPVLIGNRLFGTLGCWSRREAAFGPEDEGILQMLASQIATALAAAETAESSEHLARTDSLTGLPNRLQMVEDFAESGSSKFVVAMADIDHFKEFNDAHGHDFGDTVLQATATRIKAAIREGDRAYRLGGDEFVVVFQDAEAKDGHLLAQRMCSSIGEMGRSLSTSELEVTVSVGICAVPEDCGNFQEALRLADQAMYDSKRSGRNQVTLWSQIARPSAA